MGVNKKYLTIKTLTPIYPLYKLKFSDPNYYDDKKWSHEMAVKEERKINQEISTVLFQF